MNHHVEDTLRRTLESAAEKAPELPGTLAGELDIRYRRRRQRSQALLAAAGVVVVTVGVAVGLRPGDDGTTPPAAHSSSTPSASAITAEPVEKVWPQAVWKVPAKAPDGRELRPIGLIDDRTLLMEGWREFGRTEALYVYTKAGGRPRKIVDVPTPKGTTRYPSDFSLDGGQVAWWTATKHAVRIWAAPPDDGPARTVAVHKIKDADASGVDGFGATGGEAAFSLSTGGVFTVPLTGGPVTAVPRGAGLHLLSWPWAGTPDRSDPMAGPPFTRLVNLETGQSSTAVSHQGERVYACGVRSCMGTTADGKGFTRGRDGSRQKEIPVGYLIPEPPVQSRFYVRNLADNGGGLGLYDVTRGKLADTGIRDEVATRGEIPVPDRTGRLMTYRLGNTYYVIDLSKIP
ncbi:TolB-like translocation protein [Sphaerisporangium rhizosphaerae]|uniref:WD40 repeat domain-containing protein n=1 Tax=Sphaerisporangium rhizosphaerae TaxID=2269375 RepID=A0ABW2NYJ0_9ACTN